MNIFTKTPKLLIHSMKKIVWNLPTDEKVMYLTFDDGPIPDNTEWILETLEKYNAKATFFCVGHNVQKYPSLFEKITNKDHTVGNHTFNHLNSWKNSAPIYLQNIDMAAKFIDSNLFRPPYGKLKMNVLKAIRNDYQIVLWDVLSRDFDRGISPEQCAANVIKSAKNGSVIVFHDNYKASANLRFALPSVLEHYTALGFRFESLENIEAQKDKRIRLTA
jgi:peptidoglycan/xylan/chitin deacetylase (PgdA/CDA1 family)